ncbi:hypothetical protein JCM18549_06680 [Halolamina salina]
MGFGAVLFLIAVVHHATEIVALGGLVGPVVAGLLDGTLALVVVYAGYWLSGTDLLPQDRWRVFLWCLTGAAIFVAIMGLSLLIRAFEGRVIGEAIFPLLIAAESGGIAGVIAGYYVGRARSEARRARTVSEALRFVNSLIRHDLRNDLNVIRGHAQLAESSDDAGDAEPGTDSSSVIAEKADEALARIDTTGVIAETLRGEADLAPIDLAAITSEIAKGVENTYSIAVTTDIPDEATVVANKGLRSVVDNVLENAVEHNDADDPRVHVDVDASGETVELRVADNGPGLSDEQKERVLSPREGRGGGLSLVRTLVEGYDGELRIEDNDPRGSVFVVSLPHANAEPS